MKEVVHPDREHNDAYLEYAYSVNASEGHSYAVQLNTPVFAGLRGQRHVISNDELESIQAKTLVIWGKQDRFFPVSHAERAVSRIPDSQLELIDDCGHISLLDQPERVSELMTEFLLS